jgi:hypothetical protein
MLAGTTILAKFFIWFLPVVFCSLSSTRCDSDYSARGDLIVKSMFACPGDGPAREKEKGAAE